MTDDPDAAADLAALSNLTGANAEVLQQARKAMADAMAAGATQGAFVERQWAVIQATAAAFHGGEAKAGQLAPARDAFNLAVEAVRALSEAADAMPTDEMDRTVRQFQERLAKIVPQDN